MKLNENVAVVSAGVLLVPYEERHVSRYHEWMQDADIQQATASEPLTLDEEYENQQSWRNSHDKLTFILCGPVDSLTDSSPVITAGVEDASEHMLGDINLFFYPFDEDDTDSSQHRDDDSAHGSSLQTRYCVGEIDVMIANSTDRGKGLGRAAVSTLLVYIRANLAHLLKEYESSLIAGESPMTMLNLRHLMVKIHDTNAGSKALFAGLGFEQVGTANYFGEIHMVLHDFPSALTTGERADRFKDFIEGYREVPYVRSK